MSGRIKQSIIRLLRRAYYLSLSIFYYKAHTRIKKRIKRTGKANVCFVVSSLPMWRLQDLYDLLTKDSHYNTYLLLVPFLTFAEAQREVSLKELIEYFNTRDCPYQIFDPVTAQSPWEGKRPDIIFYQQMYSTIYPEPIKVDNNLDKLICYIPYALRTCRGDVFYNSKYTNIIWKLFYPSQIHADYARTHSFNKAKNVVVVGEPNANKYLRSTYSYAWKPQDNAKVKKVIWAPHYSILGSGYLHRTGFLWLAELMNEIVLQYEGKIQFVLKPHPRLKTSLYSHPDWGKEKTDLFFEQWDKGNNTQVETGEFIDLFMTSDAMIHDSGSFTAEYLYTKNPVLFTSKEIQSVYDSLDSFGTKCLDLHYKGNSKEDIISFLERIVIEGEDPLLEKREQFYKTVLLRETTGDVGYNIYRKLNEELFNIQN